MFGTSSVPLGIWVALFGILVGGTISVVGRIIEWLQRKRLPRLGQKVTSEDVRRIRLLVIMGAEMEIRELLKQAIDRGIAIENLPALHQLLQRFYMHPDRYERVPSIKDASLKMTLPPFDGSKMKV